jgi:medium-chain acyl-[acyl-carrier-protein] hydrolase
LKLAIVLENAIFLSKKPFSHFQYFETFVRNCLSVPTLASRFVRSPGASQPQVRLFCFPFAGGSAPVFAGWGALLKPEIEVWAAQPRGRGMRFREAPYQSVAEMVEDYLSVLRLNLDMPFAFYGHSLGGLVAFELTRQLQAEGLTAPEHLFIGASVPPSLGLIHPEIHHLVDNQFVNAIQERYAGIPSAVLNEPELMDMFLPVLKADFTAYERYKFTQETPVNCSLTAFAGIDDPGITARVIENWERHTQGTFILHTVPGDHFFLTLSREFVITTIKKSLEDVLSPALPCITGQ